VPPGSSLPLQPLLIIVMIAIGTYLLYSQLSVLLIGVIRKRRGYYWRGTHMLWLSELAYSMKDNARLFFAIAMVLSVSFTATGAVAVVKAGMPSLGSYPFAFSLDFTQSNSKLVQPATMLMTQTLNTNHIAFTTVQVPFITNVDSKHPLMSLMSVTNYNRLAASARTQQLTVQPGEAVDTNPSDKIAPDDTISGGQGTSQLHVIKSTAPLAINQDSFENTDPFVVSDQEYQALSTHAQQGLYIGYNVAQWRTTTSLSSALNEQMYSIPGSRQGSMNFTSHAFVYLFAYQLPNITLFIGLFTAIIFLVASGSFLYFRLYTILNANKEQYRAISKIGFTEAEMRTSVTVQVVILFFAPFLIAVINTVFAMTTLKNNLHAGPEVLLPTVETIGIFLALQVVYFLIIRAQYLNQLKQALV
jgi:putative ABC transport system permease protein